ncbi:hypothetical protein SDC9_186285 [bioreactor metagenome]|uniref:Uncharacterized protein n=1 Tax=bioreactor metagenome TaxID=1076179 RepID=A0A645HJ41_9ZZZZ
MQRVNRPRLPGVDLKRAAAAERPPGGRIRKRIQLRKRILRVPEIVSPVQKPFQVIEEQDHSQDPVAGGRHPELAVGDFAVVSAIIDPALFDGLPHELVQLFRRRNRTARQVAAEELGIGERVNAAPGIRGQRRTSSTPFSSSRRRFSRIGASETPVSRR